MLKILLALTTLIFFSDATAQTQVSVSTPLDVAEIINGIRVRNGLSAVLGDPALVSAARNHAEDMDRRRFISHTGSDGSQVAQRAQAAGFCFRYINENIAKGFRETHKVVSAWMSSEGHRSNILAPRATHFGFAKVNKSWVLVLGTPC